MSLSDDDIREMWRHVAEEVNINEIHANGKVVYQRPPLDKRYAKKKKQFDEIFN